MEKIKELFARWIPDRTVTLDFQYDSRVDYRTVGYGKTIDLPAYTRTGYDFKGWYTAKSGGTKITTLPKITADVAYYAQWTKKTDYFGFFSWLKSTTGEEIWFRSSVKLIPRQSSVSNVGNVDCYDTDKIEITVYIPDKNIANNVSRIDLGLTNRSLEGVVGKTCQLKKDSTASQIFVGITDKVVAAILTSYTQNKQESFQEVVITIVYNNNSSKSLICPINKTSTFKMNFHRAYSLQNPNVYTVKFNPQGGAISSMSVSVPSGVPIAGISLPNPQRGGCIFKGWYTAATGGTIIVLSKSITADVTYYAQWGIEEIAGYSEADNSVWRRKNDQIFISAVDTYNGKYNLKKGAGGYMTPKMLKAWAMVESGGDSGAFLKDPLQVNNPGDWVPEKTEIGLSKYQIMTPETSAPAALEWYRRKGFYHDDSGQEVYWRGDWEAFKRYNGNTNQPDPRHNSQRKTHAEWYADEVMKLGKDS